MQREWPSARTACGVIVAATLLAAINDRAYADEISTTLNGYGTVGGSFTSDRNFAFRHDVSEFNGASSDFYVPLDSRIGAQAVFSYGTQWSATIQELVRLRGDKSFNPGTEWLYVQYAPTPEWKLRVGRVALDTFLFSESREVGYSLPWFESPPALYGAEPFQVLDGGQVIWQHEFGHFNWTLQAGYGTTETNLQFGSTTLKTLGHDTLNASAAVEYQNLLLKVSITQITTPISLPLGPTDTLTYEAHDRFIAMGAQYDNGKALVIGEWARRSQNLAPVFNEPGSTSKNWYVAAGWHFGKVTPLLSFSNNSPGQSLFAPKGSHNSVGAVLRWDVVQNIALKAQVMRAKAADNDYWVAQDLNSDKRVNIYSIGADFLF
jgi:hypothetical protein